MNITETTTRFLSAGVVALSGLFAAPPAMACEWCSQAFAVELLGERSNTLAGQELLRAIRNQAALGLGLGTPSEATETVLAATGADASRGAVEGERRPDFRLVGLDGDWVMPRHFDGEPLLVYFWATWCATCRSTIPDLQRLSEAHGGALNVVGLAIDEPDAVRAFAAEKGLTFPIAVGNTDATATLRSWGNTQSSGVPLLVLVGRDGMIRWRHFGTINATDRAHLDMLLAENI